MVDLERAAAVDAAAGGGVHHAGDAGAVRHANGAAAAQQELAPRLAGEGLPGGEGHGGIGGGRGGRGAAGQLAPQLLLPLGDLLVNLPRSLPPRSSRDLSTFSSTWVRKVSLR